VVDVMSRISNNLGAFLKTALQNPREVLASQLRQPGFLRGVSYAKDWPSIDAAGAGAEDEPHDPSNALRAYFEANTQGPGILKWLHYFDIYNRHLAKFVGKDVHVVEIGVYSGGSLGMWRSYLGPRSRITGVDIEPACKSYENEYTKIVIGDQADRSFWKRFRDEFPPADIVIDDGGHTSEQQIVTLEETLPYLRPGGVFICEDVHGLNKNFVSFVSGLHNALNAFDIESQGATPNDLTIRSTPFQAQVHSIHHYPYVVVVEKHEHPMNHLWSVRRGTEWQPIPI
jgi:23S rRNA U2552 (ribose-2'-O)-methylase RlmE/FtsJ